jgi:small-conductance mechanosensitive channel
VGLINLALYQQVLRSAERIKTLRREIDEVSREIYERLDDLDIILEKIPSAPPQSANPVWIGEIEAADEREALAKAAEHVRVAATKLIATRRR